MNEYVGKESAIYIGSESFICEIRILEARFEFLRVDWWKKQKWIYVSMPMNMETLNKAEQH